MSFHTIPPKALEENIPDVYVPPKTDSKVPLNVSDPPKTDSKVPLDAYDPPKTNSKVPDFYVPPKTNEFEEKPRNSSLNEQPGSAFDMEHLPSDKHRSELTLAPALPESAGNVHSYVPGDKSKECFFPCHEDSDMADSTAEISDESDEAEIDIPASERDELDLVHSIKGMYRIFDLITEQDSDCIGKIIISQNSLKAFINDVYLGAYTSMTKINFKALDKFLIKPVGVYGSKEEIVRFLRHRGVIDNAIAAQLLVKSNTNSSPSQPTLRSGLYILKGPKQLGNTKQIFLVYWPEETTWDDNGAPSVRHHRVMFMRYITRTCDQLVALISPEHAKSIVWKNHDKEENGLGLDDPDQRVFRFKVTQTEREEDSVKVHEGFKIVSEHITAPGVPNGDTQKNEPVKPFLLQGETAQGFATVELGKRLDIDTFEGRSLTLSELRSLLASGCLQISESLDEKRMQALVRGGLHQRFPNECSEWITNLTTTRVISQRSLKTINFIRRINSLSPQGPDTCTLRIDDVEDCVSSTFRIWGSRKASSMEAIYALHVINLTAQDQRDDQLNATSIPCIQFKISGNFHLPMIYSIMRAQLLEEEKLLLVVADSRGNLTAFLERLSAMDEAIKRRRGKALKWEMIGENPQLAYDESKRMLSVVAGEKLQLSIFVFDDARGFQALGSPISLAPWYPEGTSIKHACFVSGSEEILFVDSQAQARVFSVVTLSFRPATLHLEQIPHSVSSTPDGSCLLVAQAQGTELAVTAYHWSTFGSTEAILLDTPGLAVDNGLIVTSLFSRTSTHLVTLDLLQHTCWSYVLDVTHKANEFNFRGNSFRSAASPPENTSHRCLLDCFPQVWTRFPVLPAIEREAVSASGTETQKTIVFVTDRDYQIYATRFGEMVLAFERETKKPTGDAIKSTRVTATSFSGFTNAMCRSHPWNVSQFRAGRWIVDFLCLIPIQIAVAKDNMFIPLQDGVYSTEWEKSLLGADVNRTIDSLSFGWYESLFQSYMASKPVKVVSSMGERSVGKSYALDHLVDTSLAGSHMLTGGVWMSVTSTQDSLIAALDFEGVYSNDRSPQEAMLLVLFNTAIANLMLFRSDSSLNRDITELFEPFHSASTMMDPKANSSLFQSTLVVTIKDVVDFNKAETLEDFSLKLRKYVHDEREINFISRLHNGNLEIMPWPVFQSKEFYELFSVLKTRLDQQGVTHRTGGEFLYTMKTLMAKLKANDWGPISQTMASHRVQRISTLLANAFAFGFAEIDPEREVLKNFDTDIPVDLADTPHQLLRASSGHAQPISHESALAALQNTWHGQKSRQHMPEAEWIGGLSNHLESIVNIRVAHVREWLTQNISRFYQGHPGIIDLKRAFQNIVSDVEHNVQLCGQQCSSCELLCVRSQAHSASHDCRTNHTCTHECGFCLESSGRHRPCSMTAGHLGKHVCAVIQHLCGEPCGSLGKYHCLDLCAKAINHPDEEHLCAALAHTCGKPCCVSSMKLADGSTYSCPGRCRIPSDVIHVRHECDAQSCSIPCQLCNRSCSHPDHMHGRDSSSIHLCEQEHFCAAECSAPGNCEIETVPDFVITMPADGNEAIQYTKYTQVAKKLKCMKTIPPGAIQHEGTHTHSLDAKVIHLCETRCEMCGYFCSLPVGHPQREHETHHGSMSRARWTADGPDDVVLDIDGRELSPRNHGVPSLCNIACQVMGRHVHIGHCRAHDEATCTGNQAQHIAKTFQPSPDKPKDFLTHDLFWKRIGFKDPYSKENQRNFAKCDAMCHGPEHTALGGNMAPPSYCVLPLFHSPLNHNIVTADGYISQDGHQFSCIDPMVMYKGFQKQGRMQDDVDKCKGS